MAGVIGFIGYFLLSRRKFSLRIVILAIIVLFGLSQLIDSYGFVVGRNYLTRSEQSLMLDELNLIQTNHRCFLTIFYFLVTSYTTRQLCWICWA